jgi:ketosteroid isomerase-like protein
VSERPKVELARAAFDALRAFDAVSATEIADPEVEWHSFFALGQAAGAYRGHDGTRQYVADLQDAFESIDADIDDWLEIGDLALLVGRICYRGRTSGAESASPAGWVFKFRDGKVVYFRAFVDPKRALESLGVST